MKLKLIVALLLLSFTAAAQPTSTLAANRVIANDSFKLKGVWYKSLAPNYRSDSLLRNGRIAGGYVTWQTGLTFNVTPASYVINSKEYNSASQNITLNAAHPTLPRIDVIGLDTTGNVIKITGVANANPQQPQTNPANQLYLTFVKINAASTTPSGIFTRLVYDENLEWASSAIGSGTSNFNYLISPYSGLKSTVVVNGASADYTINYDTVAFQIGVYTAINFKIKLSAPLSPSQNIKVFPRVTQFTPLLIEPLTLSNGFNKNLINVYQDVTVLFSETGVGANESMEGVSIYFSGTFPNQIQIDQIRIQGGTTTNTSSDYITSIYRKTGTDSVFQVKNNISLFAFKDSIGSGGGGGSDSFFNIATNGLKKIGTNSVGLGGFLTQNTNTNFNSFYKQDTTVKNNDSSQFVNYFSNQPNEDLFYTMQGFKRNNWNTIGQIETVKSGIFTDDPEEYYYLTSVNNSNVGATENAIRSLSSVTTSRSADGQNFVSLDVAKNRAKISAVSPTENSAAEFNTDSFYLYNSNRDILSINYKTKKYRFHHLANNLAEDSLVTTDNRGNLKMVNKAAQKLGLWVNNSFPGVVQPADIIGVTGAATFVFNNNVTISGGNQDLANNHLRSTKTSFSNNATLSYSFTINTKPATANDGIWFGKVSAFGVNYTCYVKLERTHADSFKLVLFNRNGVSTIIRMDSSANSIFMANGADYEMDINIGFQTIGATIKRVVAGKYVAMANLLYRQPSRFAYGIPNMGAVGFGVLGGSYTVNNIKEFEHDIKGADIVIVGTSISQGYHSTSFQTHWINRIFSNSKKTYINYGQGANSFVPVILNLPQVWNTQAKLLLLEIGVNDPALNMRLYYNAIIDSANARGLPIVILKDFQDPARDSIIYNICTERGVRLIDAGKLLTAQYLTDGVHPNDKGMEIMAEACVKQYPDIFGTTTSMLSPAMESLRDVNINYATLVDGHLLTYDTLQKKFINRVIPNTAITNSDGLVTQTANFRISGFGSAVGGFAIGSLNEGGFPLKVSGNTADAVNVKIENLNTASASSNKYASLSFNGTNGFGIADFQNALVVNSYGNGGIVNHSFTSGFKWNVNNGTNRMVLTNAGNLGVNTTPNSRVHIAGSFALPYREATATATLDISDYTINCTSNSFTVNLPTAVGIAGRIYVIKNSGSATTITLDGNGTETIDGTLTQTITTPLSVTVQSTGANWIIL